MANRKFFSVLVASIIATGFLTTVMSSESNAACKNYNAVKHVWTGCSGGRNFTTNSWTKNALKNRRGRKRSSGICYVKNSRGRPTRVRGYRCVVDGMSGCCRDH